jgi:hypothetical protein
MLLWCTEIRSVNDVREGDHGMDIIRIAVARRPFSLPKNFSEMDQPTLLFFGFV